MELHVSEGRLPKALRVYQEYERRLKEDLGIAPSERARTFHANLKIQQFWQIAAAIKQTADFADWHIYCQKQNQHQILNEHHQVLDDYIKQAQDLLAQHHNFLYVFFTPFAIP